MPPKIESDALTDRDVRELLFDHFLGENYYVVDPLGPTQVNKILVEEIFKQYPDPKFPRACDTRPKPYKQRIYKTHDWRDDL